MYWQDRMAKAQDSLSQKKVNQIERQIKRYYSESMERVISSFTATYVKVLSTVEMGKEPTPADLYKLDSYWKMQGELRDELQKLGDKQMVLLSKEFEAQFEEIYNSIALHSDLHTYNSISKENVTQMVNQIWTADGKSWSQRIWRNTDLLADELNDGLLHCVVTGQKASDLKKILMERFNVSFGRADALVRTEIAHIQTQAAQARYKDAGIRQVEVWAEKDERRCDICGELHQKKFPIDGQMPVPAHPRCRCVILPVIE